MPVPHLLQKPDPIEGEVFRKSRWKALILVLTCCAGLAVGVALIALSYFLFGGWHWIWNFFGSLWSILWIAYLAIAIWMYFLRERIVLGNDAFQIITGKRNVRLQVPYDNLQEVGVENLKTGAAQWFGVSPEEAASPIIAIRLRAIAHPEMYFAEGAASFASNRNDSGLDYPIFDQYDQSLAVIAAAIAAMAGLLPQSQESGAAVE